MPNDLTQARDALAATLREELERVVSGAAADLQGLATTLAANAVAAASMGRDDLLVECRGQARALAEVNRMRLSSAEWAVFDSIVGAALRALAVGVTIARNESPPAKEGTPA